MPHKILVADDNLAVQRLVSTTLLEEGFEVMSVSTGPAALVVLELMRNDPPGLILADFSLEGMHLFTFVQKVRQDDRLAQIPIVALIHSTDSYDPLHLASVGILAILKKPVSVEALLSIVRTQMSAPADSTVMEEALPLPMQASEWEAPETSNFVEMAQEETRAFNPDLWSTLTQEYLPQILDTAETTTQMTDWPAPLNPPPPEISPEVFPEVAQADPEPDENDVVGAVNMTDAIQKNVVTVAENVIDQVVRQVLPELLKAALTKEAIQAILEKVTREVILPLAETEIIKEIKRLQPEEVY